MADLVVLVEPGAGCTALVADSAVQQGLHIHLVLRHKGVGLEQPEKNIPTAIKMKTKIINKTELFAVNIDDDIKLFIYYILFVLYNIIYKNY